MNEFAILSDKYKIERQTNFNIIFNNLLASIIDMFEFGGLPESVKNDMIIRYTFCNGVSAIPLKEKNPPVCICSLAGDIDAYGYGTEIVATTQNGKSYHGKIGEDFAVLKNNTYMYPEFYILQTAKMLTELYTSLKCNIINARLAPIGRAKTDNQVNAITKAFEEIYKGKPYTIKDGNVFDESDGNSIIVNLTDVKNSQYIPYLSQLEDDILQKFYYHYGINMNNVNKRAQVSAEEVTGADPLVWTVPMQKLKEFEKGIEMLKPYYPNASVGFGGIWKKEYERYMQDVEKPVESVEKDGEENADDQDGNN